MKGLKCTDSVDLLTVCKLNKNIVAVVILLSIHDSAAHRRSQDFVWEVHFFLKVDALLVVALKTRSKTKTTK